MDILLSGNYTRVPLMSGSNKNDGTLILSQFFDYILKPDNLQNNEYFLKYKIIELMTESFGMEMGYAFKSEIQNAYFWPSEMGEFTSMIRGLTDVRYSDRQMLS